MTIPPDQQFLDRIFQSIDFAVRYHGDQRYGDLPYIYHLTGVAWKVLRHGGTEDQVIAAILHDVVEDTDATLEEIEWIFGESVAAIVASLTHDPEVSTEDYIDNLIEDALLVKLCDSEFNLERLVTADMPEARRSKLHSRYASNLDKIRSRLPQGTCRRHAEGV